MDNAELEETVRALQKLVLAQQGAIVAQRVVLDAVVSSLATLPTFLETVNQSLTALEPVTRSELEVESEAAYDSTIPRFNYGLDVMLQRK